jgi:hypothetical protein
MTRPFLVLMVAGYVAATVLALLDHLEPAIIVFFAATVAGFLGTRGR